MPASTPDFQINGTVIRHMAKGRVRLRGQRRRFTRVRRSFSVGTYFNPSGDFLWMYDFKQTRCRHFAVLRSPAEEAAIIPPRTTRGGG